MKPSKLLSTNFVQCVPWQHIEFIWGKREFKRFMKWMSGQTCLEQGAYLYDIQQYAKWRNRGVTNPPIYD